MLALYVIFFSSYLPPFSLRLPSTEYIQLRSERSEIVQKILRSNLFQHPHKRSDDFLLCTAPSLFTISPPNRVRESYNTQMSFSQFAKASVKEGRGRAVCARGSLRYCALAIQPIKI